MDNPFWNYSLAHYSKPGVAPLCLAAQDELGADVNLLLLAAWLASAGRTLDAVQLASLLAATAEWREQVIAPLRALRRQWKGLAQAAALREQLKALELQAERELQACLYRLAAQLPGSTGEVCARANLQVVLKATGASAEEAGERAGALAAALLAD
ncbi:TIGR02444 family protein [Parahaliea mediterranea]|uniref:TIGR02444 family protein n=1 Tax=Parahaliea mediterranea TaxID=651086 RepID=UPI000E2FC9E3|nr:TIGR02444 family protein [Parahaliea mediterranea]